MRKSFLILVIGSLFLLLGLAACVQSSQRAALPPTPISIAQILPTGAAPDEEIVKPAQLKISPTVAPTVKPISPATAVPTIVNLTPLPPVVSGIIQGAAGPIAGAIVQVQGAGKQVKSAADGSFQVSGLSGTTPAIITAWSEGHYVGWVAVNPSSPDWKGSDQVKITLKPLPENDNLNYPWFSFGGVEGSGSCGLCHREYDEWKADA
ncbi:MAG: hypothetical protein IH586_15385, partial [Anaerolineaceae bacterium]|nr:hypothetical protein [Anaerolineaceae bacterium]